MNLLKEISSALTNKKSVDLKNSDASDAGASDVAKKQKDDVGFSLVRNTINTHGDVTGSAVANYLERAAELNDEVDTVQFGLETDDGEIVKVYVNAEQEAAFGEALKNLLGIESDIEEAINRLATEFDIVDVVWPAVEGADDIDDLDQIDLDTALDDPNTDEDDLEEFASLDADPEEGGEEEESAPKSKSKSKTKKEKKDDGSSLLQSITAK